MTRRMICTGKLTGSCCTFDPAHKLKSTGNVLNENEMIKTEMELQLCKT